MLLYAIYDDYMLLWVLFTQALISYYEKNSYFDDTLMQNRRDVIILETYRLTVAGVIMCHHL